MSVKLLLVALVCAVAYAQADAGFVFRTTSDHADCSAGTTVNAVTGECMTGTAYYFDSSNVYAVTYSESTCVSIASITQYPTGCGKAAFGTTYSTNGTSATMPFSFPPEGYQTSSTYVNVTAADAKNSVCSVVSGVVSLQTAVNVTGCRSRESNKYFTQPSSTQSFCNADGTASGSAVFSDSTCTSPVSGTSTAVESCTVAGSVAIAASCGSTATFPSDIPTQGWVQYTNEDCTSDNPTTHYVGPTCFDSQTMVCGPVNGTDGYVTYTQYSIGSGADGSCDSQQVQQVVLPGSCVKFTDRSGLVSYRKYTCQADGPGASASTASVSFVATLLAAVAAVFAVRSL